MKQIFDHRIYLSFDNGKTWEDTNILKNWEYRYPEFAKEDSCTIRTYDDARTFVLNSCIPNATIRRTMFGNECIDLTTVPRMYGVRLTRLVDKTPSDGLCGKTDEDNLGMTYRQLDDFLEKGTSGDEALDACIHRMHLANVHKLLPMPQYYLKR